MKKSNVLPISNKNDYRGIFRERIEKLRTDNKLDIKEMCKRIDCSTRLYSSWINGDYNSASGKTTYTFPSIDKLMNICDAFGVSLDWLMGRTDYTSIDNQEISKITGLHDTAIEGLKKLVIEYKQNFQAFVIASALSDGDEYKKFTRTTLSMVNAMLSNPGTLQRFAKAFYSYHDPDGFKIPVTFNKDENAWEQISLEDNKLQLASREDRLDDTIEMPLDALTIKAMAKNTMGVMLDTFSNEYGTFMANWHKRSEEKIKPGDIEHTEHVLKKLKEDLVENYNK